MGIWNEIQEQLKELQQLLDERKQLDEIYNTSKEWYNLFYIANR